MGGLRNSPNWAQLFPSSSSWPLVLPSFRPLPQLHVHLVPPLFPCSPHFLLPATDTLRGLSFIFCSIPSLLLLLKVLWDPVLHQVKITHCSSSPCSTFQPSHPTTVPSCQNHPPQALTLCISLSQSA